MVPAPHTPLVLLPEDVPAIEAIPLHERALPASTYELLDRSAITHPYAPALYLLGEDDLPWRQAPRWTYGTLLERVHQAANAYLELGLPPGGVVALMPPNLGATYAALLGAQAVGIVNPVNERSGNRRNRLRRTRLRATRRPVADRAPLRPGRPGRLLPHRRHDRSPQGRTAHPRHGWLLAHPQVRAAAVIAAPDPHSTDATAWTRLAEELTSYSFTHEITA